jgi:hypothetical protein
VPLIPSPHIHRACPLARASWRNLSNGQHTVCLCSGLATGWSAVQGVLPTVLDYETEVKRSVSRMPCAPNWATGNSLSKTTLRVRRSSGRQRCGRRVRCVQRDFRCGDFGSHRMFLMRTQPQRCFRQSLVYPLHEMACWKGAEIEVHVGGIWIWEIYAKC